MKNTIVFLLLLFLVSDNFLHGQRSWELGFNAGYITHNALNLPNDLQEYFSTKSIAANLSLMKNHALNEKIEIFGGVGLNSFFFEETPAYIIRNNTSHYFTVLYGLRRSAFNKKASLNLFIDHNILYSSNSVQHNQVFTNVNLGMSYFLFDKLILNTFVPITIYPMFSNKNVGKIDGDFLTLYRSGVYNIGLYLGVSYLL